MPAPPDGSHVAAGEVAGDRCRFRPTRASSSTLDLAALAASAAVLASAAALARAKDTTVAGGGGSESVRGSSSRCRKSTSAVTGSTSRLGTAAAFGGVIFSCCIMLRLPAGCCWRVGSVNLSCLHWSMAVALLACCTTCRRRATTALWPAGLPAARGSELFEAEAATVPR